MSWESLSYKYSDNGSDMVRYIIGTNEIENAAMIKIKIILKDQNISTELKIKTFESMMFPTVLDGAGNWVMMWKERRKLMAFETTCLRRITNRERYTRKRTEV